MLVKGVGRSQFTLFIPDETVKQREALVELKKSLIANFGGYTELPLKGYWVPPQGVVQIETGVVIVVIIDPDDHTIVRELAQEFSARSGEEQVLVTRNNVDVFYINKEQS